ncbi:MAG: excinuclease ABC subunit UvrA [Candidatus Obscuribacterales bacterium]|nr:excinuclease ABC subunit UvrA [Candidatus Obscuribacterales bacterium]
MNISDPKQTQFDSYVHVRGARQNNLRNVDVDVPRDAFVVFTGVSGSGKSSIAFDTIYAEAQRRYFESVAPYARRLIGQLPAPRVTEIRGLPPAVALQQKRAEAGVRSSVGTLTTLSNSLRMLFSRAGTYPEGTTERLDSDAFSPNTPVGMCDSCHGIGIVHSVTESSLVPDPTLSIREHAIAAWPGAWQGKNLRDILAVLGYDIDKPWKDLSKKDRDWILFTDEKPVVTVYAERDATRIQRPYQGTYMSAAHYVRHTFATTKSETLRKRAALFMQASLCSECGGKRLHRKSLGVTFGGYDIADLGHVPLADLPEILLNAPELKSGASSAPNAGETSEVAALLAHDLVERIGILQKIGLDYLALDRATPTLSAGELQRLRLATQLRSGLFGVVYVLDEPSAGLHPADTEALLKMLTDLKDAGNTLFLVEHDMDVVRQADWIVDVGPDAGERGGELLYSGPVPGLKDIATSHTRRFLFESDIGELRKPRTPSSWLSLTGVTRHNLKKLAVAFPLGVLTAVTGVSGSGKSTLVSKVLAETVAQKLGQTESKEEQDEEDEEDSFLGDNSDLSVEGLEVIGRLVCVDQKPIGRTPRSNLATYTGLFDNVRQRFAATDEAKKRGYNAGRFSFNVDGGRCPTCEGEGFVSVELLFLPSVYTPCKTCHGTRYNTETLKVLYNGLNVAEVLDLTVDAAYDFFESIPALARSLKTLKDVGLGYLKIGQPATELSGGEAQRIKLATELQRAKRGHTLYLLDEPTTGLHPADTERLMLQLHNLVDAGNSVIVVEHDMGVVADADWVIDLGPGGGNQGGRLVAAGTPVDVSKNAESKTATYLAHKLKDRTPAQKPGAKRKK